jgi:hypothetical protein
MDGCNRINRQSPEGRAADAKDDLERKPADAGELDQECDDSVDDGERVELNIREDTGVRQMLGAHMDNHTRALK